MMISYEAGDATFFPCTCGVECYRRIAAETPARDSASQHSAGQAVDFWLAHACFRFAFDAVLAVSPMIVDILADVYHAIAITRNNAAFMASLAAVLWASFKYSRPLVGLALNRSGGAFSIFMRF